MWWLSYSSMSYLSLLARTFCLRCAFCSSRPFRQHKTCLVRLRACFSTFIEFTLSDSQSKIKWCNSCLVLLSLTCLYWHLFSACISSPCPVRQQKTCLVRLIVYFSMFTEFTLSDSRSKTKWCDGCPIILNPTILYGHVLSACAALLAVHAQWDSTRWVLSELGRSSQI